MGSTRTWIARKQEIPTIEPEHKTEHKCHILNRFYQGGHVLPGLVKSTKNTITPAASFSVLLCAAIRALPCAACEFSLMIENLIPKLCCVLRKYPIFIYQLSWCHMKAFYY